MALTDSAGNTIETYAYDVYGRADNTSSVGNPYFFTGRRFDTETALYYYRARYYSPEIGRFLQVDAIGYQEGMNLYMYAGNNPIYWLDPFGLCKDGSEGSSTSRYQELLSSWQEADAEWQRLFEMGFCPVPRDSLRPSDWELKTAFLEDAGYGSSAGKFYAGLMNLTGTWGIAYGVAGYNISTGQAIESKFESGLYIGLSSTDLVFRTTAVVGVAGSFSASRPPTGSKIPGTEKAHRHPGEIQHGFKDGHKQWLEYHYNPADPSKARVVRRQGPID